MIWNDSAPIDWARHRIVVLRPQAVLGIYAVLLIIYMTVLHPWLMNWGATAAEQRMTLVGATVAASPATSFTRDHDQCAGRSDLALAGSDRPGSRRLLQQRLAREYHWCRYPH